MGRPKLIKTKRFPYHVTARSNNQEWFYLPMQETWVIYEEMLSRIEEKYGVSLISFVLMSNHFHLLLSTPNENISQAIRYFTTEISREIGRRVGRINHIFGGRYRWSVMWSAVDFAYVYKYVYRNPVRAGICSRVERYPYSTLRKLQELRCRIPMVEGFDGVWKSIPREFEKRIDWLNQPSTREAEDLIRRGLRHYEFHLSENKTHKLERGLLRREYGVESEPVDKSEKVLGTFHSPAR